MVKAFNVLNLLMYMTADSYIFYKPFQVLSQFSAEGDKKTLAYFFSGIKKDVYPVGRLDYDSEGLLVLTNNKQLNHRLLNPAFVHEREYWVQVEGIPTAENIAALEKGVSITVDGKQYRTKPAKIRWMQEEPEVPERNPPIRFRKNSPTSWLSISLIEGKNRQVRKMTAAVNLPTLRLIRYRIGSVTASGMQPGDFIKANDQMLESLFTKGN